MKEFRHGLINRNLKYSFTKHTNEYHHQMTTLPAFKVEVEGKCRVDFVRLLTECEKNRSLPENRLRNSKIVYGRNKLVIYQPKVDRV